MLTAYLIATVTLLSISVIGSALMLADGDDTDPGKRRFRAFFVLYEFGVLILGAVLLWKTW